MKYIRTKESINPVEREEDIELFEKTGQRLADTIEELCDCFIKIKKYWCAEKKVFPHTNIYYKIVKGLTNWLARTKEDINICYINMTDDSWGCQPMEKL